MGGTQGLGLSFFRCESLATGFELGLDLVFLLQERADGIFALLHGSGGRGDDILMLFELGCSVCCAFLRNG